MTRDTIVDPLFGLMDKVLKSKIGEDIKAIRLAREGLRAINDVLGQPVCSAEERAQRRLDRMEQAPPPPSVFRKHIP
jgi:hypothetical protein